MFKKGIFIFLCIIMTLFIGNYRIGNALSTLVSGRQDDEIVEEDAVIVEGPIEVQLETPEITALPDLMIERFYTSGGKGLVAKIKNIGEGPAVGRIKVSFYLPKKGFTKSYKEHVGDLFLDSLENGEHKMAIYPTDLSTILKPLEVVVDTL